MVYTAEWLPLVAGPLVAFYWSRSRCCQAAWELELCIWKMKAKHHKKLPGRLYRDSGTGGRPGQLQWIPTNTARCLSLEPGERVTGPYMAREPGPSTNGNMNLDKTSGWLSTFQFAPGLIVYCECEWVYLALMQLVISLESWLPSVIRDQDGIKRNNKHDPFRNNLLGLFFSLISWLVITSSEPVRC